jgi:hypothetical protein
MKKAKGDNISAAVKAIFSGNWLGAVMHLMHNKYA